MLLLQLPAGISVRKQSSWKSKTPWGALKPLPALPLRFPSPSSNFIFHKFIFHRGWIVTSRFFHPLVLFERFNPSTGGGSCVLLFPSIVRRSPNAIARSEYKKEINRGEARKELIRFEFYPTISSLFFLQLARNDKISTVIYIE